MQKICSECGTDKDVVYSNIFKTTLCRNCIKLYKNHPINPLPKKGQIEYDSENRLICHICGRAFRSLNSHIICKHNISVVHYKRMFSLDKKNKLISEETKQKLREIVFNNYDIVVLKNLIYNRHNNVKYKKQLKE